MTASISKLSVGDYNAVDAVNISTLKELWSKSAKHYQHRLSVPRKDSVALQFGRLVHTAVFEPHKLATEYAAEPEWGDCRRTENKKRRDAWRGENAGKQLVSIEWFGAVTQMARAVQLEPEAAKHLRFGQPEVTLRWEDEETGVACKGRVDWLGREAIVGLKTTATIDLFKFANQAAKLGYHLAWAFYSDGYARSNVELPTVEIVVESEPPYDVVVYDIPEDVLDEGRAAYREALAKLKSCRTFKEWPGVANGKRIQFALPRWATTHDDDDMSDLDWGGKEDAA